MRKNILIIAIGLIFIVSISQVLLAQGYYRDNLYRQRDVDYYNLKLTESQLKKIDELELNLEKEISPLLSKLRVKELEYRQLYYRANPDEQKIEAKINEMTKIEDTIMEKERSYDEGIRNLLTKEQKATLDSYYGNSRYDRGLYGQGLGRGYSRGYYGQGLGRGYGKGYYGQGIGGGYGRGYYGQGQGRLGRSNFRDYGRGYYDGMGLGRGLGRHLWRNYGYGRGWR